MRQRSRPERAETRPCGARRRHLVASAIERSLMAGGRVKGTVDTLDHSYLAQAATPHEERRPSHALPRQRSHPERAETRKRLGCAATFAAQESAVRPEWGGSRPNPEYSLSSRRHHAGHSVLYEVSQAASGWASSSGCLRVTRAVASRLALCEVIGPCVPAGTSSAEAEAFWSGPLRREQPRSGSRQTRFRRARLHAS